MELNLEKPRKNPSESPQETRRGSDLLTSIDFTDLDKITEDSLGFSALTDGLGFHPKERELGTVRPSNEMDSTEFIAAREYSPAPSAGISETLGYAAPPAGEMNTKTARPIVPPAHFAPELAADPTVRHTPVLQPATNVGARPATARERFAAFLIDVSIVVVPIWFTLFWNFSDEPSFLADNIGSSSAFIFVVFLAYLLISESLGGQSLGKMALDLVVVEDDKYRKPIGFERSLLRLAFFLLGSLPAGLGSIASLWDSNSRAWHDRLSGSAVERLPQD